MMQTPVVMRVPAWTWANIALAALVVLAVCCTPWLQVNLSPSAPRGLWLKTALPPVMTRPLWVITPVPMSVEAWVPWWRPLLKPVAAVAGERVCLKDDTLWIMGRNYGRVYTSANGRPLPRLEEGCLVIRDGEVFLASPQPQSLDSRYFGPVPVSALMAEAIPLWTWR